MADTLRARVIVLDQETRSPLGGVEVELVGMYKAFTDAQGRVEFDTDPKTVHDLKVRSPQLRPTYKLSGEFWLDEYVRTLPTEERARYPKIGSTDTYGVSFSENAREYRVSMLRELTHGGTLSASPGGKVSFDEPALEDIVVAGTNVHDNTYGNKMMFLAQAVREIRRRYNGNAYVSFLVFPGGYTSQELEEARQAALKYNPSTVFIQLKSKDELVNYINTRTTDLSHDYREHDRILVKTLRVFSHGLPSALTFDLDGPDSAALRFERSDVASLAPAAFAVGAHVNSFACRTGNTSGNELFGADWKTVAKPEESLAQALAEQLGASVHAFITRSNYGPTFNDAGSGDGAYHADYVDLPDASVSASLRHPFAKSGAVIWNRQGAFNEPVSGKTPDGLADNGGGGVFRFDKGKAPRPE